VPIGGGPATVLTYDESFTAPEIAKLRMDADAFYYIGPEPEGSQEPVGVLRQSR
jgi:hypothetical protein